MRDRLYYGLPLNQLNGIPKPASPFRRIDVPSQQQQQQQGQRKPSTGLSQQLHYRPQTASEQSFVPPTTHAWAPPTLPSSQNPPPTEFGARSNTIGSNRYPPQPTPVQTYQPNLYNPAAALPPQHFTPAPAMPTQHFTPAMPTQHFTPAPVMSNQQFVHGSFVFFS